MSVIRPTHSIHQLGVGAFIDTTNSQEEHRFVEIMVDDEHQGQKPTEMVHQAKAEQGIAHLADRRVGQQPFCIFLKG